jgi:6-phosphogluconolactonase (cycloisomerase 2 family)
LTFYSFDPINGELVPEFDLFEGGDDALGNPLSGLRGARGLAASEDGRFIYLSSQVDDAVLVFEVVIDELDDAFGGLVLRQKLNSASAGMSGFNQPIGLAMAADQQQLYVAAANSSAIYVFDRLPNGQLSLSQVVANSGTIRIDGVSALTIGPEDRHLYAAGTNAGAVAVFARDTDGTLTHLQTRSSPATPGLVGVAALAVEPDGRQLYALGRDDNAIVVFNREADPESTQFGRLLSGIAQRIEQAQVADLSSPRAVVLSPDGGSVYIAA